MEVTGPSGTKEQLEQLIREYKMKEANCRMIIAGEDLRTRFSKSRVLYEQGQLEKFQKLREEKEEELSCLIKK